MEKKKVNYNNMQLLPGMVAQVLRRLRLKDGKF
jgi:hypothetical protein